MGFFDNLFKKKECDICGGEIGLLGNRKLEDGNLCKDCAAKLSPWFDDRRHSTVEEIRAQLDDREQNRERLASFQPDTILGEKYMVYIDRRAGTFVVSARDDYVEQNADVLEMKQIQQCTLRIADRRTEKTYKTEEGEEKSYSPPRYIYEYDFYIRIRMNHPYIDDFEFRLNRQTLSIETQAGLFGMTVQPTSDYEYLRLKEMGDQTVLLLTGPKEEDLAAALASGEVAEAMPEIAVPAEEPAEKPVEEEKPAAAEPAAEPVVCPYCDSKAVPTPDGCCSVCGAQL